MKENSKDFKFCIKLALDNAKKRINLLDNSDKKCVIEEYKKSILKISGNFNILKIICS